MNGAAKTFSKSKHLINKLQPTITSINFTNFYSELNSCASPIEARYLFDKIPRRGSPHFNLLMRYYTYNHQPDQVLHLFAEMLQSGDHLPDNFTYPLVFKACGDSLELKTGEMVHCRVVISGHESNEYVQNALIAMYMNCGKVEISRKVFEGMLGKSVVSWNSMISGYVLNGRGKDALRIFRRMMDDGVGVDQATVVSVLPACGYLKELQIGRLVHELVKEKGLGKSISVRNSLVDMYAKCGCICEARTVFDEMIERDVVSWTAMIGGYVSNGDARSALALCLPMQLEGIRPNSVTVANLLSGCLISSDLKHGQCIHGWVTRFRLESDVVVETSLIDLYAKCNCIDLSLRVFAKTSRRRTVPWNAIISGYVHNRREKEAIECFKQMQVEMVEVDSATLISLLPAYAVLADMHMANNIHGYLIKSGFLLRCEISSNLVDVYAKSGSLDSAHEIFNWIPEQEKDIITWTTIIAGYGMHGHGEAAISIFDQMVQAGVKPNEVTFTSVLQACSHAGLEDEALRLFKSMMIDNQGTPCTDQYTCIIDVLGRSGRLKEAYELINAMPSVPNHAVWGALLGACVIHQEVELGEVAAKWLFEVDPHNTGNYILLSKLYAAAGRWEDAENVRILMNGKGLKKLPGCSSIEVTRYG